MTTEERPASREEAVARVMESVVRTFSPYTPRMAAGWSMELRAAIRTELEAAYEAGRAAGRREGLRKVPLSIDCDGCGQVVVIPAEGSVPCGCNGVMWSLTKARAGEQR